MYSALVPALEAIRTDAFERSVFEYFDFLAWAKSKVNGKKYRDQLAA